MSRLLRLCVIYPALAVMLAGLPAASQAQRAVDPPRPVPNRPATQPAAQPGARPTPANPAAQQQPRQASANQRVVYVKREGAPLKAGVDRTSPDVRMLRMGEPLTVLQTGDTRLQVRANDGATGYVATLNVSDTPPARSGGGAGRILVADNMGPAERGNVSAARGLSPMAEKKARESNDPANEKAVEEVKRMERLSTSISAAEIDQFLKEGDVRPQ